MKIALAQIEPVYADWSASVKKHKETIYEAIDQKADWILFPEMSLSGYALKDMTTELCVDTSYKKLQDIIQLSMQIDIVVGFPEIDSQFRCYISQAYCSRGEIIHIHRKIFLPINGLFNDAKDFIPGTNPGVFSADSFRAGLLICRDMWHPELVSKLMEQGMNFLIVSANIPLRDISLNGPSIHGFVERTIRGYAEKNSIFVAYINRVGFEEGVCFYGGSNVVDPDGVIIGQAPFLEESLLFVEIDANLIRRKMRSFPYQVNPLSVPCEQS